MASTSREKAVRGAAGGATRRAEDVFGARALAAAGMGADSADVGAEASAMYPNFVAASGGDAADDDGAGLFAQLQEAERLRERDGDELDELDDEEAFMNGADARADASARAVEDAERAEVQRFLQRQRDIDAGAAAAPGVAFAADRALRALAEARAGGRRRPHAPLRVIRKRAGGKAAGETAADGKGARKDVVGGVVKSVTDQKAVGLVEGYEDCSSSSDEGQKDNG